MSCKFLAYLAVLVILALASLSAAMEYFHAYGETWTATNGNQGIVLWTMDNSSCIGIESLDGRLLVLTDPERDCQ